MYDTFYINTDITQNSRGEYLIITKRCVLS